MKKGTIFTAAIIVLSVGATVLFIIQTTHRELKNNGTAGAPNANVNAAAETDTNSSAPANANAAVLNYLEQPGHDTGIGIHAVDKEKRSVSNLLLNVKLFSDGRHETFRGQVITNALGEATVRFRGSDLMPKESLILVSTPGDDHDHFVLATRHAVLGEITVLVEPGIDPVCC